MRCKKCRKCWNERLCSVCRVGTVKYISTEKGRAELWRCDKCGAEDEVIRANGSSLPANAVGYVCSACSFDNTPAEDCFLTTACVRERGLADDCYELTVIRRFRDEVLRKDDTLSEIVDEYYRTSPLVVAEIDSRDDYKEIYERIYEELVKPCVEAIERGDLDTAVYIYRSKFAEARDAFLG